jgi:hypothetical protein
MEKALEAQKAAQAQVGAATADTQAQARAMDASESENDGASTVRVKKGKGSEHQVKAVPTDTVKYASDLKYRGNHSENGRGLDALTPTSSSPLPRKRRGKK